MRIINLLNLIAKGEKVPKKIKFDGRIYKFESGFNDYYDNRYSLLEDKIKVITLCLNDEVEIIEEEKEIEKIIISMDDDSMPYVTNNKYQKLSYSKVDLLFASKINELIDEINKLKRDKE